MTLPLPPPSLPALDEALALAQDNFSLITRALAHWPDLDPRIQEIITKYTSHPALTSGQSNWITNVLAQWEQASPLYGDFKPIWIMFMLAGEALKAPKIRLIAEDDTFVQLNFIAPQPERQETNLYTGATRTLPASPRQIKIFRDGWQGHGKRRYIGRILEGVLYPHRADSITPAISNLLQAFSLNPAQVAQASAHKLGACSFCATRLSDPESKARGYGPICAGHYALPWGDRDEKALAYEAKVAEMPVESLL